MISECDEIGFAMPAIPIGTSFDECVAVARRAMGNETETVICNVADALWRRANPWRKAARQFQPGLFALWAFAPDGATVLAVEFAAEFPADLILFGRWYSSVAAAEGVSFAIARKSAD